MTTVVSSARRADVLGRFARRADPVLIAAASICTLLVLLAIFGPLLAPYEPNQTDILATGQGPSSAHLLGTDSLGRDIFSRLLAGGRLSFFGPAIIVLVSVTAGTTLGIAAAWRGGVVDSLLAKSFNVIFALPGILLAIVFAAAFGAGFWAPVIALSLVYTPYIARIVRSTAIAERNMAYIEACQLANFSGWRICTRHILRNVAPVVLAQATLAFGSALKDFGATSFLGVGVQAPQAEWGLMVADGRTELLAGSMQQSLSAGCLIVISAVAFNVLGERISNLGGRR